MAFRMQYPNRAASKRIAVVGIAVVAAALLAGCSHSKAASDANFAAALDTYYGANTNCVLPSASEPFTLTHGGFPLRVPQSDMKESALAKTLVQAHVLRVSGHGTIHGVLLTYSHGVLLSPTPTYKDKVVARKISNALPWNGPPGGVCAAHRRVVKVTNFKKISAAMAALVGGSEQTYEVKYTYRNVPVAWARIPSIAKVLANTGGPTGKVVRKNGDDAVNMTHNGWRVISLQ